MEPGTGTGIEPGTGTGIEPGVGTCTGAATGALSIWELTAWRAWAAIGPAGPGTFWTADVTRPTARSINPRALGTADGAVVGGVGLETGGEVTGDPLDESLPGEVPAEPVEPVEPVAPVEPVGVPPPGGVGDPGEEPIGLPTWELNPPPPPPGAPPRPNAPVPPPAGAGNIVGGIAIPLGVAMAAGTAPVA